MTPQAYKDEIQPVEKAPADVEQTNGAFQVPPPHKKPIAYKVLFTIGTVFLGVALLLFLNGRSVEGEIETAWWFLSMAMSGLVGVMLLMIGAAAYPIDKKSR